MKTMKQTILILLATSMVSQTFAKDDEHSGFTPVIMAFHNVMAPLWHAESGDTRMR